MIEILSIIVTSLIQSHRLLRRTTTEPAVTVGQPLLVSEIPVPSVQYSETNPNRRLSEAEITQRLQQLSGWKLENQTLIYTHTFNNFIESVNFINCLVEPAEKLGHHPDISVSYNKVKISLTTHDQGGLTSLDFQLAETISNNQHLF